MCAGHAGRQAARDGLGADAGEYRRAGGQGVVPAVAEGTGGSQPAAGAGKQGGESVHAWGLGIQSPTRSQCC